MNLSKQTIYITSINNMDYWGGYLPGTATWGYTRKSATVKNVRIDEDEDIEYGTVKIKNVELTVCRFMDDGEWKICSKP